MDNTFMAARQAMQQQEVLLGALACDSNDFIFVKDRECRFVANNRAHALFLGQASPDDCVGKTDLAFFPEEEARKFIADEMQVMETGLAVSCEEPCARADRNIRWVRTTKVPLRDEFGVVVGIVGTSADITGRKEKETAEATQPSIATQPGDPRRQTWRLEQLNHELTVEVMQRRRVESLLRESEVGYRLLFQNNPQPMLVCDMETQRIVAVNDAAVRQYGCARQEFLELTTHDIRSADDVVGVTQLTRRDVTLGERPVIQRHRRRDGSLFDAEVMGFTVEFQGRSAQLLISVDVTEKLASERELQASQQRLRVHLQGTPLAAIEWSKDGKVTTWNPSAEHIFGYSCDQALGMSFDTLVPESLKTKVDHIWTMLLHRSGGYHSTHENLTRDGRLIVCEWFNTPLMDEHGYVIGVASLARDVTSAKRIETALRESEDRYRRLIGGISEVIFELDLDGRFRIINPAWQRLTKVPIEISVGKPLTDWIREADRPFISDELGKLAVGRLSFMDHEVRLTIPGDGERVVQISATPTLDSRQNIVGIGGSIHDLTDRASLEAERLRSSKLESIGLLAGGIAHDFNNIITAVTGNIQLAAMEPQSKASTHFLDNAETACCRAGELARQLLTFAKGGAPTKTNCDILKLTQETMSFCLHGTRSEASLNSDASLWHVMADPTQLGQVLQNLLINADQAMPDGGKLSVSANNVELTLDTAPTKLAPGRYVRIEVKDTGCGIEPSVLERIFDPYFTTKASGSGLGLSVAYSIVDRHGGLLRVESTLGKGTTFTCFLPAMAESKASLPSEMTAPVHGQGRVLVMDDETPIRNLLAAILHRLGYEAVTAADGTEAMDCFNSAQAEGRPISFGMFDLTIPGGMGGKELLKQIQQINPNFPAIVVSGYSDDPVMSDCLRHGFKVALPKPFVFKGVAEAISRIEILSNSPSTT
jgi:PAS domain S-box-containing protein